VELPAATHSVSVFPEMSEAKTIWQSPIPALPRSWPHEFSPKSSTPERTHRESRNQEAPKHQGKKAEGGGRTIRRGLVQQREGERLGDRRAELREPRATVSLRPLCASAYHSPKVSVQLRVYSHLHDLLRNVCFHPGWSPVPPSTKKIWIK
jgi:hypothetical protein